MKLSRYNVLNKIRLISLFITIYLSHSSMGSIFYLGKNASRMLIFFMQVVLLGYALLKNKYKFSIKKILIFFMLALNILITMFINQDFINGYIVLLMSLVGGFFFHTIYSKDDFYNDYVKIMVLLAAYSIISTYLIVPIGIKLGVTFPSYTNENGVRYLNTLLATPIINYGFNRNTGIYLEPGMFQVFLSFALIFELFLVKRRTKEKNLIFILIASLMTFSPVGLIQNVLIFTIYLMRNKKTLIIKDAKRLFTTIFFVIFIIIILFNRIPELPDSFIGGIDKLLNQESSYQGRLAAILSNMRSGFDSPFVGKGISNGFTSTDDLYLGSVTKHNTSTSTVFFMVFGIMFFLIMLVLQYFSVSIKSRTIIINSLLFITTLVAVNSQLLIYDQVFYIIIFSSFMKETIVS